MSSQPLLSQHEDGRLRPSLSHFFPRGSTVRSFIGRRLSPWYRHHHYQQQQQQQQLPPDDDSTDNDRDEDEYEEQDSDRDYDHHHSQQPYFGCNDEYQEAASLISRLRSKIRSFLSSRWGHYLILFLVSVDVACIFADFLIELHTCELQQQHRRIDRRWGTAKEILSLISLVFSCLFMLELILATSSFGSSYFQSKFRVFDALVIIAAFVFDVVLRGVVEEISSIIVVLRLWRVFKIIEEISAASADIMEKYEGEMEQLQKENRVLKRRLRAQKAADIEADADAGAAGGDEASG